MSRKSTRNVKVVAEEAAEAHLEVEDGKKIRSRIASGSSNNNTPVRRSERTKLPPLYSISDSEDSPSPAKNVRTKSGKIASIKLPKASSGKAENEAIVPGSKSSGRSTRAMRGKVAKNEGEPEEDQQESVRRSSRAAKPTQRFINNDESTWSVSATPTGSVTSAEGVDAISKRSTRTRKAETPVETPPPVPTKLKRKNKDKEDKTEDTPETPRSSRRPASQRQATKGTLEKSATVSSTPKEKGSKATEVVGKNLGWKFNIYGVPECPLPCRESQFEDIWKFLFENVTEKNSGCMYVSGVPGTGKTVIVQAVIDTMKSRTDKEKKNLQFKYLYINGLSLASPDKIWKRMFKGLELSSKSSAISTKEALKRLDLHFECHQRIPVILVVDELDQILDKQQSILYQLLEWSSHAKNMFSFVAIFNTMSLPEHGLAMRNCSRMGFKRAVFPPYSYEQLQAIVSNMLSTFKTTKLSTEAVTLLSRKVAAISGDARRALEIARRAVEIAEAGNLSGIQAVSNAFKEIFSSAKIETIKYTSLLEQIILKAICDEIRCNGVEEVLTAKIYENVLPKAVYEGMNWPKDEILKALMRLSMIHLVIVEDNFPSLHKRVLLKVPVEDVNFALGIHNDLEA